MTPEKVWLITGAGRGLGVDIARAALAVGHAVVATGRDAAMESLTPEIAPFGIRTMLVEPGFFRTELPELSTSPAYDDA